jgi:hypothetical protein
MFTVPDGSDAAVDCPPFKPVGPKPAGFWQDCDPESNFAGTIPLADYFNELVVNLRGLLYQTFIVDAGPGVTAVKGDSRTLAQAVLRAPVITQAGFFIYVNPPIGSPEPNDPIVNGDAFDSLSSALSWLARYRLAPQATVLIDLAPTYINESQAVIFDHPDGHRIYIRGDDKHNTQLNFPGASGGLIVKSPLGGLYNFTIVGNNNPNAGPGLLVDGGHIDHLDALIVTDWAQFGPAVSVTNGGFIGLSPAQAEAGPGNEGGTLTVYNCQAGGLWVGSGSEIAGISTSVLTINQIGRSYQSPFWWALLVQLHSGVIVDSIQVMNGCAAGVRATGSSHIGARLLGVGTCDTASAVQADNNSEIAYTGITGNPGDWWTWNVANNTPQYFQASQFSVINPWHALASYNIANASPAVNVLGNTQSMVISS